MDEQTLLIATWFTFTGYWTVFFIVRMGWHSGVNLALRHSPQLFELSARLPQDDPASPFLAAYIREGLRGATDLAVYALLRRGAIRFVNGILEVMQPSVMLPTLCERCAFEWAVVHHGLRPNEQTYFQHSAFQPIATLSATLQGLGLIGEIGVSRALKAWTHVVAVVFMGGGLGAAIWLYLQGAGRTVVIALIVSSIVHYLWFRTDEKQTGQIHALVLSHLYMHDRGRWGRLGRGETMQWQDAMWVGGVNGVVIAWSARIAMRGHDNRVIVTGPPGGWFTSCAPSTPPTFSGAAETGGH